MIIDSYKLKAFDSAAVTIFNAMSSPTDVRKDLINSLVVALKNAGVWAKLDCLYIMAAADSAAARINWKNPGTYNLTEQSSPTFTADRGYTGNGSSSYLSCGVNNNALTQFTQNSLHYGAWSLTDAAVLAYNDMGTQSSTLFRHRLRTATNIFSAGINGASTLDVSNSDSRGHFVANRSASNARQIYRNATSLATDSVTSTALTANNFTILRANDLYSGRQIAAAHIGASLSGTEVTNLYNALTTYLTAVGAV